MIEILEICVASAIFLTIITAEVQFLYGKWNEGVDPLLFLCYSMWNNNIMDRDKLKLMVRNLELLVDDIKAEVFSDVESYVSPPPSISQDYDEILEDDDGYPD